jgi:alpha-D-ribose 1-methylphosphonate 5-triphosphate diphosphatase
MSKESIFTNARIVTADSEFDGTLVVRDGRIVEVAPGRSGVTGALDLDGDYLVPGLVELHTDNMEKHFAPRPGVMAEPAGGHGARHADRSRASPPCSVAGLGDVRGDRPGSQPGAHQRCAR